MRLIDQRGIIRQSDRIQDGIQGLTLAGRLGHVEVVCQNDMADTLLKTPKYALTVPTTPSESHATALINMASLTSVQKMDLTGPAYTDHTAAAAEATANDVGIMQSSPAVGDGIYFGYSAKFSYLLFNIGTAGVGSYTGAWQYYNGSTWGTVTTIENTILYFKTAGYCQLIMVPPSDWATATINSISAYYLFWRLASTNITTAPLITQCWVGYY